jgi:hypothetical protein
VALASAYKLAPEHPAYRRSINVNADDTSRDAGSSPGPRALYPVSIAYLIEERPLLWCEDPKEYDQLRREIFAELAPEGALNCIFVKNVVDCLWEFRRMKMMKHTAINYAMPDAAGQLIAPGFDFHSDREEANVRRQAAAVAFGAGEDAAGTDFAERMHSKHVTPEMIHYKALNSVSEKLHWISRECERLEGRFHRLLKDFEGRRTALAAMAKSLVEREKAEVVNFKEVN